jgi:hypothetical protein
MNSNGGISRNIVVEELFGIFGCEEGIGQKMGIFDIKSINFLPFSSQLMFYSRKWILNKKKSQFLCIAFTKNNLSIHSIHSFILP